MPFPGIAFAMKHLNSSLEHGQHRYEGIGKVFLLKIATCTINMSKRPRYKFPSGEYPAIQYSWGQDISYTELRAEHGECCGISKYHRVTHASKKRSCDEIRRR